LANATLERAGAPWLRNPRAGAARPPARAEARAPRLLFWMLMGFIVLEYLRPPVLPQLKLQMLVILAIPVLWIASPVRPWTRVLTLQTAFLLWCVKSLPLAFNYYNVYMISRLMYGNVAIGIALTWVGSHLRDLRRLIWIWLAVMCYQAFWALTHNGRGTGGFFGDENDLALACATALAFALAGLERMPGRVRWLLAGAVVLLLAGIVASFSRGGFVGLVAMVGYLIVASRHRVRSLALIGAGALLFLAFAPSTYLDELRTIQQTDDGTAKGRKFLWKAAYNMWLDHPVLGVGAANSAFYIGRYQPHNFEGSEYNERDWSGMALHSSWFTLLAEHGIVGVVLFTLMVLGQFQTIRRLRRDVRARSDVPVALAREVECLSVGLNGAVAGFVGCGTFLSVLYYPYIWYFTVLAAALDIAVRRELAALSPPSQPERAAA
jgi:O-antigen ligase